MNAIPHPEPPQPPPRLLVSVRDAREAVAAIRGGCNIVDVKEPTHGSLGMADQREIDAVVAACVGVGEVHPQSGARFALPQPPSATREHEICVSVALGETADWLAGGKSLQLPDGVTFAKLGLAGMNSAPDWRRDWERVRGGCEQQSQREFGWIAVAYADFERAGAPRPDDVVSAAAGTGCAGVLFDTWEKADGMLLDHLTEETLADLTERIRGAGLLAAVAGGLRSEHLPSLRSVRPDVIAVRGAACRRGVRTAAIDSLAVAAIRRAMEEVFEPARNQ